MMPTALRLVLLTVTILGGSVWIGGMVAVTLVSRTSRAVLAPADRVALFKAFGPRVYGVTGAAALIAAVCGLVLLIARGWDGLATAIAVVLVVLAGMLLLGVRQARAMRTLRIAAHQRPDDAAAQNAVISAGRQAGLLRSSLAVLTLAVLVLSIATTA